MVQYNFTMILMITTTAGGDSKYLFPGNFAHEVTAAGTIDSTSGYLYWDRLNSHGHALSGKLTHFAFFANGANLVASGDDLSGRFSSWSVYDQKHPDQKYGSVQFNSQFGSVAAPLDSLNHATQDTIMDQLSAGTQAKFALYGNVGNDTLRGSHFADTLNGGQGRDLMMGGQGDDAYVVDNKGDKIADSGGQHDYVVSTISYQLTSAVENLYGSGLSSINLTGNAKGNYINGTNGKNVIRGLDGQDKLDGGLGHDTLVGGADKDRFYFREAAWNGDADVITDFKHGTDQVWLAAIGFDVPFSYTKLHEKLDADAFYASKKGEAHDLEDRILYNTKNGKVFYDEDGTGSDERILLATLSHHPTLHASDFTVYWA